MTFNNPTTPVSLDALAVGRSSTAQFITVFQNTNPTTGDVNYPIQQRWFNTALNEEWILIGYNISGEIKTAIWRPIAASSMTIVETLTGNTGGAVGPDVANNINVIGDGTTIDIVGNPVTHTLTVSTTGAVATIYTENTGTATASGGNLNVLGAGSITTNGSGDTITAELTGLTNHAVLVGAGTATITKVGPGATGTILAGNTGADPSFQTIASLGLITSVNNQVFTTSGTYTPTTNMVYCSIQAYGGGGAGGGAPTTSPSPSVSAGAGGGAGETAVGIFSAATIGASQTITIGAGGIGVSGTTGGSGGNTSVGILISAFGGIGGTSLAATTIPMFAAGGNGGTGGSGGDYRSPGQSGWWAVTFGTGGFALSGHGGNSPLGAGGAMVNNNNGGAALGYGAGGAGAEAASSSGPFSGGNGTAGVVIITEYIA
jgi:hypothetical protein